MIKQQERSFSFRWGVPLLDDHYTQIPNIFLRHYAEVGVSRQEFLFVLHLASYKYESANSKCKPSLETIASEMGYAHVNGVRKLAQSLEEKKLLAIHHRPGRANEYNFAALSEALIKATQQKDTPTPECNPTPQYIPAPTPECQTPLHPSVDEEKKQEQESKEEEVAASGEKSTSQPNTISTDFPKTDNPLSYHNSPTSTSPPITQNVAARDPLDALAKHAARKEQRDNGRPAGWTRISQPIWEICQIVAEQYPCRLPIIKPTHNETTKEIVLQKIDKWTGGATLILESFDDDKQAAIDAVRAHRREFDGGFTVAGPQSLVNVLQNGGKKRNPSRDGGDWTDAELEPARQASLAEQPIDPTEFFDG